MDWLSFNWILCLSWGPVSSVSHKNFHENGILTVLLKWWVSIISLLKAIQLLNYEEHSGGERVLDA
jgi:hypothetical protein